MAKTRMLNTKFWTDSYIIELDPSEKLLYVYLITNPYTDICGIYELSLKIVSVETGFEKDTITRILKRFEQDGKIMYRNGWVALKNFVKNQSKNPKVEIGINVGLEKAPKELKDFVSSIGYDSLSHLNLNSDSDLKNYSFQEEKTKTKKSRKKKEIKKSENYLAVEKRLVELIESGEFKKKMYDFPIEKQNKDGKKKIVYDWRVLINHGEKLTPLNFYMASGFKLRSEISKVLYESDSKEGFLAMITGKDWSNIKKLVDGVKYQDFKKLLDFTDIEAWDSKRKEYKWNWDFGTALKALPRFNSENE